jgi:hypothetical protein
VDCKGSPNRDTLILTPGSCTMKLPFLRFFKPIFPSTETDAERRSQSDRRETPTSAWAALPPAGRRICSRRAEERRLPHYTDRFPPALLLMILMLLAASMVDATLTLQLIRVGCTEVNPLMGHLLECGVPAFLMGKYALTAVGLPILVIFRHHYLFGTRLRVEHLIPVALVLYAVLIAYQFVLVQRYWA